MSDAPSTLTIEIPFGIIHDHIREAVRRHFDKPGDFNRSGAEGWRELQAHIKQAASQGLPYNRVRDLVDAEIDRQLAGIVREQVGEYLASVVREEIKRQKREGVAKRPPFPGKIADGDPGSCWPWRWRRQLRQTKASEQ